MSANNSQLGPFRLERALGRGGMGEVWRGVHVAQGTPVALKVVTAEKARVERFHDAFRREVQAMAKLRHPGIVVVLDYGRVPAGVETWSRQRLTAGSPYLAMELAESSLDRRAEMFTSWPVARDALLQLLDALAHAHARDVVHRDIKPPNILVNETGETGGPCFKLADFGLAHPLDRVEQETSTSGTPKYMSPEQIMGDFRQQGPWTDLYALGCVAYWMVTRSPPFDFPDSEAVLRGHLLEPLPPLGLRFGVPAGFAQWLERMLAKDPLDRFRRAADARWALAQLADVEQTMATGAPVRATVEDTLVDVGPTADDIGSGSIEDDATVLTPPPDNGSSSIVSRRMLRRARLDFRAQSDAQSRAEARPVLAPPMPTDWRFDDIVAPMQLIGAGINLYGLRPVPIVDRDAERDEIWAALRRATETKRPQVIVLSGPSGTGKSRVAEWMSERAEELGAARRLRAVHSPMQSGADGLGRLVANYLRTVGLDRLDTLDRMQHFMSPDGRGREFDTMDVLALTDLAVGEGRWLRNASAADRHAVLGRFVGRAAWDRPAFIWLDDVQWGADAIGFAQHLCTREDIPALVLLTVRDDIIEDEPAERLALQRLLDHDAARRVELGPLAPADHRQLVKQMLRLAPAVAEQIIERTEGNPLFAVQLVGDWVERGLLGVGTEGFVLRDDRAVELPDSIHNLWSRRIERAVDRYAGRTTAIGSTARHEIERALQIAAAIGQEVEFVEWQYACSAIELDAPFRLVEELENMRLAHRTDAGFRFAHGMLAESLLRHADEDDVLELVHAACASMLEVVRPGVGSAERRAMHYVAANHLAAAVEPLLVAAEESARRADFERALELDLKRDDVLDTLQVSASDPRRIHGTLRRCRTLLLIGRMDEAGGAVESVAGAVEKGGDLGCLADLQQTRAACARFANDSQRGIACSQEALKIFEQLDDRPAASRAHRRLGELLRRSGDLPGSIKHYEAAIDSLEDVDEPFDLAWAYLGLGTSERQASRFEAASQHIHQALAMFSDLGSRVGLGNTYNELGELDSAFGDYESAEKNYRMVLATWNNRPHAELCLVHYNIAMTLLPRGRWAEALLLLDGVMAVARDRESAALIMLTASALSACLAGLARWDEARTAYETFADIADDLKLYEPALAEAMTMLAEHLPAEHSALARAALGRARHQYEMLGNELALQSVDKMLDELT